MSSRAGWSGAHNLPQPEGEIDGGSRRGLGPCPIYLETNGTIHTMLPFARLRVPVTYLVLALPFDLFFTLFDRNSSCRARSEIATTAGWTSRRSTEIA